MPSLPWIKDIVDGDIAHQADKAYHHARFGAGKPFALTAQHLKEQVARRAPQQTTQERDRFLRQSRLDAVHVADDEMAVVHQRHDDQRQPETLAYLMGNAVPASGAVKLRDDRRERQQQAVTK